MDKIKYTMTRLPTELYERVKLRKRPHQSFAGILEELLAQSNNATNSTQQELYIALKRVMQWYPKLIEDKAPEGFKDWLDRIVIDAEMKGFKE